MKVTQDMEGWIWFKPKSKWLQRLCLYLYTPKRTWESVTNILVLRRLMGMFCSLKNRRDLKED